MTDHPAASVYDQAGILHICRPVYYRRFTYELATIGETMQDDCAVTFFFFPRSSNGDLPLNACISSATLGTVAFNGDVVAVMHYMDTGELIHIEELEDTYVDSILWECAASHIPNSCHC